MTKYLVGAIDQIPPGARRIVKVGGRSIGVFNVAGQFYALWNVCIHNQAPVCLGQIDGTYLPSAPDEYRPGLKGQVLRCPWHGWEFDITTGCSLFDSTIKLETYPVIVEAGQIYVEVGKRTAGR